LNGDTGTDPAAQATHQGRSGKVVEQNRTDSSPMIPERDTGKVMSCSMYSLQFFIIQKGIGYFLIITRLSIRRTPKTYAGIFRISFTTVAEKRGDGHDTGGERTTLENIETTLYLEKTFIFLHKQIKESEERRSRKPDNIPKVAVNFTNQ
jgi:hypothetical protein